MSILPKKTLGKGLSALLGDSLMDEPIIDKNQVSCMMPIHLIRPGQYQPRLTFNDEKLQMLIDSIQIKGIIQPLIVRQLQNDSGYEIIAGERRWRAAKTLELKEVPVIITDCSDNEAFETAIVENIQRDDLTPMEEALAYKRMIDEFSYTQEALAKVMGKSRSHVANMLRLNNLPQEVQDMIQSGRITAGHARTLITSKNPIELAQKIITDGLNVRQAENLSGQSQKLFVSNTELEEQIRSLQNQITEFLDQKTQLKVNKSGASLTILFKKVEEIDDFLEKINPKNAKASEE